MPETRTCTLTGKQFQITDEDRAFYERIGVPLPTLAPLERRRQRLAYRNDRKLYRRACDLCKQSIIATHEEKAPYPVYCNTCWWSDKWNAENYGREFNFNRPFFEQWHELNSAVPHIALWQIQNENSDFSHDSSFCKDCYMLFGADYNRNCYYSANVVYAKDCCDCLAVNHCERLYECTDCFESQFDYYSQLLRNSSNCYFCFDMINCHNCFGSAGLRNKSYYFYNEQLTPEEYEKRMKEILPLTHDRLFEYIKKSYDVSLKVPRKYLVQKNCEDSVGGYLGHCKNVHDSFDLEECRDASHCAIAYQCKDISDCEVIFYNGEVCYGSHTLIKNCFMCFFSFFLRDVKEAWYCNECYSSQNLFGCVGLRQKKFYILNKEYPADEYHALVERIKNHMIEERVHSTSAEESGPIRSMMARRLSSGSAGSGAYKKEFGEFFPIALAPFAYNESAGYDYILPSLNKEEAVALGYRWKDEDPKEYKPQTFTVPLKITDVTESIMNELLACTKCGKNFKITKQELIFYKQNNVPIPIACFDCRHRARLLRRGPRVLYDRACQLCNAPIKTIYAPERPEMVYCEACYLATVY